MAMKVRRYFVQITFDVEVDAFGEGDAQYYAVEEMEKRTADSWDHIHMIEIPDYWDDDSSEASKK